MKQPIPKNVTDFKPTVQYTKMLENLGCAIDDMVRPTEKLQGSKTGGKERHVGQQAKQG